MIYSLTIFGDEHKVDKDELIELLESFTIDQINDIYFTLPKQVRNDLADYFKKRMGGYLGI